ncbi:hypothetical protein B0H12DRAFT_189947 [Mycena haematopus]|nr:hypothetical protein B0H12DRAFT_189947 [Mycena haematopus]
MAPPSRSPSLHSRHRWHSQPSTPPLAYSLFVPLQCSLTHRVHPSGCHLRTRCRPHTRDAGSGLDKRVAY